MQKNTSKTPDLSSMNYREFSENAPVKKHTKELYHAVRKAIKLEGVMTNFKVLFLVGGPGSGKDFLIHSVLDECKLKEVSLDKLFTAIKEQQNIDELTGYPSVIVNGNADNKDKIIVAKAILESMGYDTAMIYVHTSNEESKSRNDLRISRGAKTFSEGVRQRKYSESLTNLHLYTDMFESFVLYDNSNNFSSVNENMQQEITNWLLELSNTISGFLSKEPSNEAALDWIAERVLEIGTKATAKFAKGLTPGQGSNKIRSYKDADKYAGGVKSANVNSPTRTTVEEKKNSFKKKQSLPPSVLGDVRNMAVGSTGIASVPAMEETKTKKKRKFQKFPLTPMTTALGKVANFGNPDAGIGLTAYKVDEELK
ncbi:AAA domain containing protein [uncultured Caudovirales phage]|uniref:AAA domain containing protein n=1 Tax=uncultured Caudovirales phage TaxID=2100421 RepID=A0A6J5KTR6_9CAUD|nr:AAA domain containing protein [uncultured Caudovirales phage]